MEADSRCRLLELPAELRTIIWTLTFTHDDLLIDLVTAKGFSTALLSKCSQIYGEAITVWKKACSEYWSTVKFEISCNTSHDAGKDLERLQEEIEYQEQIKEELKAMLTWYKIVVRRLLGLEATQPLLLL